MKSIIATLILGFAVFSSGVAADEFSDTELVALGQSYTQAINDLDVDAMNALISARHLGQNIAEIAGDSSDEKRDLLQAFIDVVPTINQRMLSQLEQQGTSAVFLRIHEFRGMRGPLVRYSVGDGYNYVLLLPVRATRTEDEARIGDMYYATSGELLSESIGIATRLVSSPSETFLGKLFGTTEVNRELISQVRQMAQLRQQNRLEEAYAVLNEMPGNIRNHRLILMNSIQIASQISDDLYRKELRRLARHHKDDPRAAFTLLDHYFYENDFDAAMSIVDLMERSYGSDAVIFIFRANVESARNRLDAALEFADKAVDLEPDNEDAQWTLLTLLVQSERYPESVAVLRLLENKFNYVFAREDFQGEPLYDDFVKSAEFAQWIDGP